MVAVSHRQCPLHLSSRGSFTDRSDWKTLVVGKIQSQRTQQTCRVNSVPPAGWLELAGASTAVSEPSIGVVTSGVPRQWNQHLPAHGSGCALWLYTGVVKFSLKQFSTAKCSFLQAGKELRENKISLLSFPASLQERKGKGKRILPVRAWPQKDLARWPLCFCVQLPGLRERVIFLGTGRYRIQ